MALTDIDTTRHSIGDLTNGNEYGVFVEVCNDYGCSGYDTAHYYRATPAIPPLGKPVNFRVVPRDRTTLRLEVDSISRATRWEYQHKLASAGDYGAWTSMGLPSAPIRYDVGGLTPGERHTFKIRAVDGRGPGDESDPVTVLLPDVPPKVTTLAATPGDGRLTLTWNPLSDGVTDYQIQVSQSPAPSDGAWRVAVSEGQAATSRATVRFDTTGPTALANGALYYAWVRARTTAGAGPASNRVAAVPVAAAPVKPAGVTATAGNARVTLAWTAQSAASGWEYRVKTTGGYDDWRYIAGGGHATNRHVVTGLSNDTAYTFEVRAMNVHGNGPTSDEVTATPTPPPAKPAGVTADRGDASVTLAWTAQARATAWQYRMKTTGDYGHWRTVPRSGPATTGHVVADLNNDTAYTFEVRARNARGPGPRSDPVTATPRALPAKPAGLAATRGAASVTLAWTAQPAAARWQYQQKTAGPYGQWMDIASSGPTTATHTVTGLTDGTEYTFRVRAVNAHADGPASDPVTAIPGRPAKPAGVAAEAGNQRVTLSWTAQANADFWEYRRRAGSADWVPWTRVPMSGAGTTGHTLRGLSNGTQYTFEVRAGNVVGEGPASDPVAATPGAGPPEKPRVSAAVSDGQVTLSWDAQAVAESWHYRRKVGNGNFSTLIAVPNSGASTTGVTVSGLTNGTEYTFRVRASNGHGPSEESDEVTANPAAPPAKPAGIKWQCGPAAIRVYWDPQADATGWQYRYRLSSGNPPWRMWATMAPSDIDVDTDLSYSVGGLTPNTRYDIQIRAVNRAGPGPEADVDQPPNSRSCSPAPQDPAGLRAVPGDRRVTLTWDDLPEGVAWDYRQATDGDFGTAVSMRGGKRTSFAVTGLANGTSYTFEVRATYFRGPQLVHTGWSNAASAVPTAPPAKPAGVTAAGGDRQVTLGWRAQAAAESWEYQQQAAGGDYTTWTAVTGSGGATAGHTVTTLNNGTAYTFRVRARNAGGAGPASDPVTATPGAARPAKPTGVAATAGDRQVVLSWDAVAGAMSWQVQRKAGTGPFTGWTTVPGSGAATTGHTVRNLTEGTEYTFEVRAGGAGGFGAPSDPVKATPYRSPAKPAGVTATPGDARVTLAWTAQAAAASWQYRQTTTGDFDPWRNIASSGPATASHVVTGLMNGAAYTFEVRARNAHAAGAPSDPVSATPGRPAKPAGVTAEAGNRRVTLSWTALPTADSWQYQQKTTGAYGTWTAVPSSGAETTGHTVTGLDIGEAYTFRVRAANRVGEGPASDPVTAAPGATPDKPGGFRVTAGDGEVTLTWNAQANVTDWTWQRATGNGGFDTEDSLSNGAATSHRVTGLTNGTSYRFRVRAYNEYQGQGYTGPWSDALAATPRAAPGKPTGLTAGVHYSRRTQSYTVGLTWSPPSGAPQTLLWDYRHRAGSGDWGDWTACSRGSCWVRQLAASTTYTFEVRGVNGTVPGPASDSATAATGLGRPGAPTGFRVAPGDRKVTLTWDALAGVSNWYWSQAVEDGGFGTEQAISDGTATRHEVTELANGTSYTFRLRAGRRLGSNREQAVGPFSEEVAATPSAQTVKATGLTAMAGDGQVTLGWDAQAAAHSWQYRYRVGVGGFNDWTAGPRDGAATSFTVTDLTNGAVHTFEVRAVPVVAGGESNQATATPTALPAEPVVTATPGDRTIMLAWDAQSVADSWEYMQTRGDGASDVWRPVPFSSAATTGLTLPGLVNYTTYSFRVRARNGSGPGPASAEASAIPQTPPPAPRIQSARGDDRRIHLIWYPVPQATGWQYRYRTDPDGGSPGSWSLWEAVAGGGAATTQAYVTGLSNGTRYRVELRGENAAGPGMADGYWAIPSSALPRGPTTFTADGGDRQVILGWSGDARNWESSEYRYQAGDGPFGMWARVPDTENDRVVQLVSLQTAFAVQSLTNGIEYTFELRGRNAVGPGPSATAKATPAARTRLPAKPTLGAVGSTWSPPRQAILIVGPGHDRKGDTTSYQYQYATEPAGICSEPAVNEWSAWADLPAPPSEGWYRGRLIPRSVTHPVAEQTCFVFRVRGVNTVGPGPPNDFDASHQFTSYPEQPPARPSLTATPGFGQVRLAWPAEELASSWQHRYHAGASAAGGVWRSVPRSGASTTGHVVTGLDNGTTYAFEVRAANGSGFGRASEPATATPGPTFGEATVADQSWTENQAIPTLTLPAAVGGNGALTYGVSPLPAGLTFDGAARTVTGTPTDPQAATTHTYTATDADGNVGSLTFTITIDPDVTLRFEETIPDQSWVTDSAIATLTLPAGLGGDGALTYTLAPPLPAGLTFDSRAAERTITGTPTTATAAATYTYTVTDGDEVDPDTASLTFDITIVADTQPSFGTTVADQSYTQHVAIPALALPAATGGNGELTYALTPTRLENEVSVPDLPAGLMYDESTRRISGTPTGLQAATTYTWTATDTDGDSAELTFDLAVVANQAGVTIDGSPLSVNEGSSANYTVVLDAEPTHEVTITITRKSGDTDLTIADTDSVTTGVQNTLKFSTTNWSAAQHVTVDAAEDTDSADGQAVFQHAASSADTRYGSSLAIADLTANEVDNDRPTFPTVPDIDIILRLGWGRAGWCMPAAAGGNGTVAYSMAPTLPDGLQWSSTLADWETPGVWGMPTTVQPATAYTLTATDGDGDTDTLPFEITVLANTIPSFGAATIAAQTYVRDEAIAALQLPAATGSDGATAPTGTPDHLRCQPRAALASGGGLAYNLGPDLPAAASASGGGLAYNLSPDLPAGLEIDLASRRITGTPTGTRTETTYTWTATETDILVEKRDSASLEFTIRVDATRSSGLTFGAETIDAQSWLQHRAVDVTLPAAAEGDGTPSAAAAAAVGNGTLSYAISPALPSGVTLDPATRRLTGTPAAPLAETTYTWTATDGNGDSVTLAFPVTVSATLPAPPAKPAGVAAAAENRQVTITWTPQADATGWELRYKAGTDAWRAWADISPENKGATRVGYKATGLTNGTEYTFELRGENAQGEGAASDAVKATPNGQAPTGTIRRLKAEPGNQQVKLTWSSLLGGYVGEVGDDVWFQYRVGTGAWTRAITTLEPAEDEWGSVVAHTVTGLNNGTEYSFQVRPVSGAGDTPGLPSQQVKAAPTAGTAPDAVDPASISVVHHGSSLSASWDAPARATHYDVTYQGNGVDARAAWNREGTSLTITCDVRPDHQNQHCVSGEWEYTVGIRARNAAGESEWAYSSPAAPPAGLSAPDAVDADSIALVHNGDSLSASWDAPARATHYDVTYQGNGVDARAAWNREGTSLTITCDVRPDHQNQHCVSGEWEYTVGIRARNAAGESEWVYSSPAAPPAGLSAPDAVDADSIALVHNGDSLSASWDAPARATHYDVTYQGNGVDARAAWNREGTSLTITCDIRPDHQNQHCVSGEWEYTVGIRARNAAGESEWAYSSPAAPPAGLSAPDAVDADSIALVHNGDSLSASWDAPARATHYDVTYQGNGVDARAAWNREGTSLTITCDIRPDHQNQHCVSGEWEYTVGIRARNAAGESEWAYSSPAAPPAGLSAPDAVDADSIALVHNGDSLSASWDAPARATHYDVTYQGNGVDARAAWNREGTSLTITCDIRPDHQNQHCVSGEWEYTVGIRARNAAGESEWAYSSPAAPPAGLSAPDAVDADSIALVHNGDSLSASWDAPARATHYDVTYQGNGVDARAAWNREGTSLTITCDIRPDHQNQHCVSGEWEYTVGIRARNAAGESEWAYSSPAAPPAGLSAPDAVDADSIALVHNGDSLSASWDAPARATHYDVTYQGNGVDARAAWNREGTSLTITCDVRPDHQNQHCVSGEWEYTVGIRARNAAGESEWAYSSPPARPAAPEAPDAVDPASISVVHHGSSLSASWDAPARATHYDVTYQGNGVDARAAWNREGTSLTITCDVRPDHQNQHCVSGEWEYTVGIRARNAAGESEWVYSSPPARPAAPEAPDAVDPASISVVHHGSSLSASWDAPARATHYDVTYQGNGVDARAAWNREGTSLTITCDVRPDHQNQHCVSGEWEYTVGIRARNAGGESGWVYSSPPAVFASLSAADASAHEPGESESATLSFRVALDPAASGTVTVDYATRDGTAIAGQDYTAASGTLTFAPGETGKTVPVQVLADAHDDNGETLTLALSNASGAAISDAEATGTILNSGPMPNAWLARFGRTASAHAMEAIGNRLGGGRGERAGAAQSQLTVGGRRLDGLFGRNGPANGDNPPDGDGERPPDAPDATLNDETQWQRLERLQALAAARGGGPDAAGPDAAGPDAGGHGHSNGTTEALDAVLQLLGDGGREAGQGLAEGLGVVGGLRGMNPRDAVDGSSFDYSRVPEPGAEGGLLSSWSAWGRGARTFLDGADGPLSLTGDVVTATFGADAAWNRFTGGLALSHSLGEGEYAAGEAGGGALSSTLTSLHPYGGFEVGDRLSFWGAAGGGTGRLELTPERAETAVETSLSHTSAGFGGRGVFARGAGGFELAVAPDALYSNTVSEAAAGLAAGAGAASRVRLMLEGSGPLWNGSAFRPTLEAGLRYDGGDAETGAGFEVGGGLSYAPGRLSVEVNARALVAHQDGNYREYGYGASMSWQPDRDRRGLSMTLRSSRGATASGVNALWGGERAAGYGSVAGLGLGPRVGAEIGYGLESRKVRGLWTPFLAGEAGEGQQAYRIGLGLTGSRNAQTALEIGWREGADRPPERELRLRGSAYW